MQDAIYRYIFLKIQNEEWNINERIPSERQLAVKFSATRTMMRKILSSLCSYHLLDNYSHPGYFIDVSYKTGFFKWLIDDKSKSFKTEWLVTSPFNAVDIDFFKEASNNFDFYGHNFSKVLRSTYFDSNKKPCYILDVMINHNLVKVFTPEFLNFKNYRLFATNGQPVVHEKQIAVYLKELGNLPKTYALDSKGFLTSYASYFNFDGQLLALARIIYLDERTMLKTSNDIFMPSHVSAIFKNEDSNAKNTNGSAEKSPTNKKVIKSHNH